MPALLCWLWQLFSPCMSVVTVHTACLCRLSEQQCSVVDSNFSCPIFGNLFFIKLNRSFQAVANSCQSVLECKCEDIWSYTITSTATSYMPPPAIRQMLQSITKHQRINPWYNRCYICYNHIYLGIILINCHTTLPCVM